MMEEYNSIKKNGLWEVVPRKEGKFVVTSKWLYKIKHATDGSIEKYKARFVAQGFSQIEGVDYDETFVLVSIFSLIREVISIVVEMGWRIHQMDVKTAFLNSLLQEEVYLEKPKGFDIYERDSHVCRIKKVLYGLKQVPRASYLRIDSCFLSIGFQKSEVDPNLYYIVVGDVLLILLLYIDELFTIGGKHLIEASRKIFLQILG